MSVFIDSRHAVTASIPAAVDHPAATSDSDAVAKCCMGAQDATQQRYVEEDLHDK